MTFDVVARNAGQGHRVTGSMLPVFPGVDGLMKKLKSRLFKRPGGIDWARSATGLSSRCEQERGLLVGSRAAYGTVD